MKKILGADSSLYQSIKEKVKINQVFNVFLFETFQTVVQKLAFSWCKALKLKSDLRPAHCYKGPLKPKLYIITYNSM